MATVNVKVNWADNTDELKQHLLDGTSAIDQMKQSVDQNIVSMDAWKDSQGGATLAMGESTQGASGLSSALQGVGSALQGLSFSGLRSELNNLASDIGITTQNLGLLGTAGAILGAGYVGWKIGTMVYDFTKLDEKIDDTVAGWERIMAKSDVLTKALSHMTEEQKKNFLAITDSNEAYKVAIDFNKKYEDQLAAARKALMDTTTEWQRQIDTLKATGHLTDLQADIQQHVLSVKELSEKYGLTTHAVELYKNQLADAEKAAKAAYKASEDARKASEKAALQFQKEFADNTEDVHKLEFGIYGLSTATEQVGRVATPVLSDYNKDLMKNYDAAKKVESGVYGIGTAILSVGKVSKPTMKDVGTDMSKFNDIIGLASQGLGHVGGQFADFAQIGLTALSSVASRLAKGDVFGAIVAGATAAVAVVAKLWGKLKELFGGPSADELAARDEFAKSYKSADEALEVLGKKFADAGVDGEEARQLIQKLFDATHVSAQAVDDAMDAINKRIAASATTAATGVDEVKKSVDNLNDSANKIPDNPYADWTTPEGQAASQDYAQWLHEHEASYGSSGGVVRESGIQRFASGGMVLPFLGRGSDTVPAMLTPGEMVLTRAQQRALGSHDRPIHTHIYLNGRQITTAISSQQDSDYQLRNKVRAA